MKSTTKKNLICILMIILAAVWVIHFVVCMCVWERRRNGGCGFGEHNVIFYLMRRFFHRGRQGPGGLLYKVGTDIALFFCFLRLLQDGFSVVLYFQHVLVSIGNNEIAVASFGKYERPVFLDKFTGQYQVGFV